MPPTPRFAALQPCERSTERRTVCSYSEIVARGFEWGWAAAWTTLCVLTGTTAGCAGPGRRAATVPAAISAAAIAAASSEQRLKKRSLQLLHNIKWAKALGVDAKGAFRRPGGPLD